jgi:SprT-like family
MKLTHTRPFLEVASSLEVVPKIQEVLDSMKLRTNTLDQIPVEFSAKLNRVWGLACYRRLDYEPMLMKVRLELLRPEMLPAFKDTFLHETAHFMDFLHSRGPQPAHGFIWQHYARKLGAKPTAYVADESVALMQRVKRSNLTINFDEEF